MVESGTLGIARLERVRNEVRTIAAIVNYLFDTGNLNATACVSEEKKIKLGNTSHS
jgi:hypothetical protein